MSEVETLTNLLDGGDGQSALIVTDNGPAYTRKTLREEVSSVAQKLARLGVKRGDVVALSFENDIELIICFIAICHLGAVASPLNAKYKAEEVEFYLSKWSLNSLLISLFQ